MFYYHGAQHIVVKHQVSLLVEEMIKCKHAYEGYCRERGVHVAKYHADNTSFDAEAFREDCQVQNQQLDFSGVGAQHQNAAVERSTRTISGWTRSMMLHAILHCLDQEDLALWPFALEQLPYALL